MQIKSGMHKVALKLPSLRIDGHILALSAILALAGVLRLVGLGAEGLWGDEILSVLASRGNWLDIVTERVTFNQPFYFLMLHFWIELLGESEFALRFPSAVFGVATVFFTFILARHLLDTRVALGVALLVAVSPVMIWYSQEVRFYALTTLLLVLSTYSLIRYLETGRTSFVISYAAIGFLGSYTHYYFLPFIAAHNLVALIWLLRTKRIADLAKWLAAQLVVSLALLPTIVTAINDVSLAAGGAFTLPLSQALEHFAFAVGLADPDLGGPMALVIAVCAITLIGCAVAIWRREKAAVLIAVCGVALAQFVVGGLLFELPVLLRYLVPTIPLWIITTCYGFAWLISQPFPSRPVIVKSLVAVGVLIVFGWSLISWTQQLVTPTKEQWRGIADHIDANALPSDQIFVDPPRHFKHLQFYLEEPNLQRGKGQTITCGKDHRVWLVSKPDSLSESVNEFRQSCREAMSTRATSFSSLMLIQPTSSVAPANAPRILCHGMVPQILGSAADDRLIGTPGDDVIHGLGGKDRIIGKAGNDVLCGGEGDDVMSGESGDETLIGNEGNDVLYSGSGNNTQNGGAGVDQCDGEGNNLARECE